LILNGITGNFYGLNPLGPNMALVSTQRLAEKSTRDISWAVKAAKHGAENLHVPIF
jgi:hypothetical protein